MKHAILAAIGAGALAIAVPGAAQAAGNNAPSTGNSAAAVSGKLDIGNLHAVDINNGNGGGYGNAGGNTNSGMANNAGGGNNSNNRQAQHLTYEGLSVQQIQDAQIKTSGGDNVGSVNHVLANKSNQIVAVTTDAGGGFFGGVFGAGKQVVIPMTDLRYDSANKDFVTSLTKNEVKSLQEWNNNNNGNGYGNSNGKANNGNNGGHSGNPNH